MTGDDKVVLLLSSLSPQAIEQILGRLDPEAAARIRVRLQQGPPKGLSAVDVVREFNDVSRIVARTVPPPPTPAPTTSAISPGTGETPIDDPIEALRECQTEALAAALRTERATTVALTMGYLDVTQAAAVLRLLPPEVRREAVAKQMEVSAIKPELLERILRGIVTRARQLADEPTKASGDELIMRQADLIRSLDRDDRREILERLTQADRTKADRIRKLLYRFDDILRVDDRTLQGVLSSIEVKSLALALKSSTEEIKNKILNNVPRRARDNISEEMELLANPNPAQIADAQELVIAVLRKLDEEGNLNL